MSTTVYRLTDRGIERTSGPELPSRIGEIVAARHAPSAVVRRPHVAHDSWSHRGLWGSVRDGDSPVLAESRRRLEAGQIRAGAERTLALANVRCYELAKQNGLRTDGIAERLARGNIAADCDPRAPKTICDGRVTKTRTVHRRRPNGGADYTVRYDASSR